MPSTTGKEIIELTDVVEEGHPDQPNLGSRSASPDANEVLDDLDLEKEIDQIFSDLGAPSSTDEEFEGPAQSSEDPLDLDDLFHETKGDVGNQGQDDPRMEQDGQPDATAEPPADQELPEDVSGSDASGRVDEHDQEHAAENPDSLSEDAEQPSKPDPRTAVPESAVAMPVDSDRLALVLERLESLEEKVARMDNLEQLFTDRLEARLASLAEEAVAKHQEQFNQWREELESGLEQQIAPMVRGAAEEAQARQQEALTEAMASHTEEMTTLVDARIKESGTPENAADQDAIQEQLFSETQTRTMEALRPLIDDLRSEWATEKERYDRTVHVQETLQATTQSLQDEWRSFQEQAENASQNASDALDSRLEELRAGLLQELQEAIPAAAARIIREEIQALSSEEG